MDKLGTLSVVVGFLSFWGAAGASDTGTLTLKWSIIVASIGFIVTVIGVIITKKFTKKEGQQLPPRQ